jgi:glycine cleavage system H protein
MRFQLAQRRASGEKIIDPQGSRPFCFPRPQRDATLKTKEFTKGRREMKEEFIPYMGYEWLQVEDETVTIGISEEGLSELSEITAVNLPAENEAVSPDEICAEIETDEGPLNIYCPIEGKVVEINAAVVENPSLIFEDPFGDGWLLRVEAANPDDIAELEQGVSDGDE